MFRAGLLLIIRKINSVQTAIGVVYVMRYIDWLLPA
jgi:bacteriorhodopsin